MHSIRPAMALAAGIAVTASLLAGCSTNPDASGTTSATSNAQEDVTVNMWGWTGSPGADVVQTMADAFTKVNPSITIKYTEVDPADYATKTTLALSSGESIDIVAVQPNHMATDVEPYLSKVSEWPDASGIEAKYTESSISETKSLFSDGELHAVPFFLSGSMLGIYNADILTQAGFSEGPKTWTEFKKLSDWLKVNMPDVLPAVISGDADNQNDMSLTIAGQTAPEWYNDVRYNGGALNTPNFVDALTKMKTLYNDGTLDQSTLDLDYGGATTAFDQGKAAVLWSGSWDASRILKSYRDENKVAYSEAGIMGIPADNAADVSMRSFLENTYAIPEKSTHKAAAAKFIDYVTAGDGVDIWAKLRVGFPPAKAGYTPSTAELTTDSEKASYALMQQLIAEPHSYRANLSNLFHQIGGYVVPVVKGQMTPQEAADKSQKDLESGNYN